jgi:hypothetical protein
MLLAVGTLSLVAQGKQYEFYEEKNAETTCSAKYSKKEKKRHDEAYTESV